MKYSSFIVTTLALIALSSCAQSKHGIKRADAFFKQVTPGNVPVDEQGRLLYYGPDTVISVYVETIDSPIIWLNAWKDGRSYSVNSIALTGSPVEVGTDKLTDKKIELRPAKGNKLWLLGLVKKEASSEPPTEIRPGQIILQGKSGNKNFIQKVNPPIELVAIPSA